MRTIRKVNICLWLVVLAFDTYWYLRYQSALKEREIQTIRLKKSLREMREYLESTKDLYKRYEPKEPR